ncbi:urea ABC transporter ATP-binding subunit UrtE [Rhodobacter sp. Har01]|uniref:urea ABC transporter ATP-binding subunit UrtE n=1 Tax=Rhodobacter sp. Har01 TaxID=2883999 RepID=UPI001D06DF0C|nr:urea ABC transporter ATP-binding subunit UrtE [Rhodobacter sp. Har01]MCB6179953.1 urea ABC transporter ATP-binding subunit UrtE [Rhodobacter sp. Har01]
MLKLRNLCGYYGYSAALQDVTLSVDTGDFVAVLGRNGVGKTTLMRALFGLLDRTSGEIVLDGIDIASWPTHRRARAGIGYVPQGRGILPQFTVLENLRMGGFARTSDRGEELEALVFEMFPMLKDFVTRAGGNLSGGQQQQLSIARALMTDPKIIVLDEPTEGIQPNIVELIEEAILQLNRKHGITVVLVEQDIGFARRASSAFAMMEKGRIVASGPIAALTDDLVHRHMAV